MSLAHSSGYPKPRSPQKDEGWTNLAHRKSELRPRVLSQPSAHPDEASKLENQGHIPYVHVHGNAKPQEPPFLERRNSLSKVPPRKAGHIHKQPWTMSIAPGKKENPHRSNVFHRCWVTDGGRQGRPYHEEDQSAPRRWTKERKTEYYEKYDAELNAKKPVDEHFAVGTNAKMWTHLQDHGVTRGGQEKLSPVPPRRTGLHAKHGLYIGRFENVQHAQIILRDPKKARAKLQGRLPRGVVLEDYQVDARPRFDNRLKDDMIRYNDEISREVAQISYDLYRPHHTRSCPQMGVDYLHR